MRPEEKYQFLKYSVQYVLEYFNLKVKKCWSYWFSCLQGFELVARTWLIYTNAMFFTACKFVIHIILLITGSVFIFTLTYLHFVYLKCLSKTQYFHQTLNIQQTSSQDNSDIISTSEDAEMHSSKQYNEQTDSCKTV